MIIEMTPSQSVGWQGIAEALASIGLAGQLVETSPNLRVTLDGRPRDAHSTHRAFARRLDSRAWHPAPPRGDQRRFDRAPRRAVA